MWRQLTIALCVLLLSVLAADQTTAQQTSPTDVEPAAVENVAITIAIPAQAVVGHERIELSISVQNTHPRDAETFTALIVVGPGLAGPESWSATVTQLADSDQGRVYRWTATVAARKTVVLRAVSYTGETVGVQPALEVRLLSSSDELHSTRDIELLRGSGQPRGNILLTDIGGSSCELEEECLLILEVRSPTIQSFHGGPFTTEGCEFIGLDDDFAVTTDRVTESLFWFVTRTQGSYGEGCSVTSPITMGNRTFSAIYDEVRLTYLPAIDSSDAATQ